MGWEWFAIRTRTENEEVIKVALEGRLESAGITEKIRQILVPTGQVTEIKGGKKRISLLKLAPGYILVEIDTGEDKLLPEDVWFAITETPGVSGFLGSDRRHPTPVEEKEINRILHQIEMYKEKPKPKIEFDVGENVKVKEGPFENYEGTVEEVDPEKGRLKINVSVFGRSTPVDLEYWQVERT